VVDLLDINPDDLLDVKIQNATHICWLTRSGNIGTLARPSILDKQEFAVSVTDNSLCGDVAKLWLPSSTFPVGTDYIYAEVLSFKKQGDELKFKAFMTAVDDGQLRLCENRSLEFTFPTGYETFCLACSVVILEGNRMIIVATVDQKLLLCGNQTVYKTCYIPIEVESIDTATVNKNVIAILQSQDGSVTAVNCHQFEVIGNYKNISKWLVGDFTHYGHQQLILFTSDSVEGGFILTDFDSCHMNLSPNTTNDVENDPDCPDGLIQALGALQNSLSRAKVQMVDKKQLLSNKRQLIQGAAMQLPQLQSSWDSDSIPHWFVDPSLVPLIGKENKQYRMISEYGKNTSKGVTLKVTDKWQRCVYDKWVIAVEVENVTEHVINGLAFSLSSLVHSDGTWSPVSSQDYIIMIQDAILNQTEVDGKPLSKRKRFDIINLKDKNEVVSSNNSLAAGGRVCFLAVTDCPSFGSSLAVTATSCINFSVNSMQSTASSSLQCCNVKSLAIHHRFQLSLQQLIDGDFIVQPVPELLHCGNDRQTLHSQLAFQTVALSCSLKVTVDVSDKFSVVRSLLRVPVSEQASKHTENVFSTVFKSVHTSNVLLSVDSCPEDSQSFIVHVLYQSQSALSHFLCSCCQMLPPDAFVFCHSRDDNSRKIVSIEQETQQLNSFLQRVVMDSRGSDNVSTRIYLKDYKNIMLVNSY
jgi:hypothetical protein